MDWGPDDVKTRLEEVFDPELDINIVDLGLVCDVEVTPDKEVILTMTLTSPACPLAPQIEKDINQVLSEMPDIKNVQINWVFDPPWDPYVNPTEDGRLELGIW
ncbi:MAG: metal-sulfur cluster assembly factor [bacterium]|jgi:metal-sulfur cluster biosynthetic enzyme